MEDELEHADLIAGDLRAGNIAEEGLADFIRNLLLRKFPFVEADRTDFRDCVDTARNFFERRELLRRKDRVRRRPALIVGGARQRWPAYDVASGVNVGDTGLVAVVDCQLSPAVR